MLNPAKNQFVQHHKGENNFISLQQSDSASEHVPSSTELSSDESEMAGFTPNHQEIAVSL